MPEPELAERQVRIELKRTPRTEGCLVLPGQPPAEDFYDIYIDGELAFRYESIIHFVLNHYGMSEEIKRLQQSAAEAQTRIEELEGQDWDNK